MCHFSIFAARVVERTEDALVKTFFAQPRVEPLDVNVLERLSRFDELPPYAMLVGPLVARVRPAGSLLCC
jgi:hypothetical protein